MHAPSPLARLQNLPAPPGTAPPTGPRSSSPAVRARPAAAQQPRWESARFRSSEQGSNGGGLRLSSSIGWKPGSGQPGSGRGTEHRSERHPTATTGRLPVQPAAAHRFRTSAAAAQPARPPPLPLLHHCWPARLAVLVAHGAAAHEELADVLAAVVVQQLRSVWVAGKRSASSAGPGCGGSTTVVKQAPSAVLARAAASKPAGGPRYFSLHRPANNTLGGGGAQLLIRIARLLTAEAAAAAGGGRWRRASPGGHRGA